MSMLKGLRALDLTDEKGFLCGKILADLGVEVIKIEQPGGDPSRRFGPFYKDVPHPEKSLFWFAYNLNKKGITLNIKTKSGRVIFRRLLEKSDFLIESFSVGYMDSLGFGYNSVHEFQPKIIFVSITPFGQAGPYKNFKSTDLTTVATSGYMYLCGYPNRAPLRISAPQACLHAGAQAAAGAMIALYARDLIGQGQHVDVSMQESMIALTLNAAPFWELLGTILKRAGSFRSGLSGTLLGQQTWKCRDGFVTFMIMAGKTGAKTNKALVEWMSEVGMADDFLKNINWDTFDMAKITQDFLVSIEERIAQFFLEHTKQEIYNEAIKRRILLYPVSTIKDIAESPQLKARKFWSSTEHPELGITVNYPGMFIKAYESPLNITRRAPLVGEDNEKIYKDLLELTKEDLILLKQNGVI